jgi:hypothetical protein
MHWLTASLEELDKFLHGYPADEAPFTVARYTGQESDTDRKQIADNPPDILLTNFMMLELILTRFEDVDRRVVEHCQGLEFLVLDELHTYRGRQGADVALLVRRLRERLQARQLVCIGTSATMSSTGTQADRNQTVATVATLLFGAQITEHDVIGETLERVTNPAKNIQSVKSLLKPALLKERHQWPDFAAFSDDPLAVWVELSLGIELPVDEPPRRARPITLGDAARRLAEDAQCALEEASAGLQRFPGGRARCQDTPGSRPLRLQAAPVHQWPRQSAGHAGARGRAPHHSGCPALRTRPSGRGHAALPRAFLSRLRAGVPPGVAHRPVAGQEYAPREIDDISGDDDENARYGFLCPARTGQTYRGSIEDLPESWLDLTKAEPKVKSTYRKYVPEDIQVSPQGWQGRGGGDYWFIPGKFRFCLNCGQTHEVHGKDINRLASLSGEGRSSATTILTLSAIRQLFRGARPAGRPA